MICPWLVVVARANGVGIVALIFFVALAIMVGMALWTNAKEARRRRGLVERGARAVGQVVFHSQKTKPGKGRLHFAKIKFQTPDGREFRHSLEHGTRDPAPPLGTKVQVAYDPANPEDCVVIG